MKAHKLAYLLLDLPDNTSVYAKEMLNSGPPALVTYVKPFRACDIAGNKETPTNKIVLLTDRTATEKDDDSRD